MTFALPPSLSQQSEPLAYREPVYPSPEVQTSAGLRFGNEERHFGRLNLHPRGRRIRWGSRYRAAAPSVVANASAVQDFFEAAVRGQDDVIRFE